MSVPNCIECGYPVYGEAAACDHHNCYWEGDPMHPGCAYGHRHRTKNRKIESR